MNTEYVELLVLGSGADVFMCMYVPACVCVCVCVCDGACESCALQGTGGHLALASLSSGRYKKSMLKVSQRFVSSLQWKATKHDLGLLPPKLEHGAGQSVRISKSCSQSLASSLLIFSTVLWKVNACLPAPFAFLGTGCQSHLVWRAPRLRKKNQLRICHACAGKRKGNRDGEVWAFILTRAAKRAFGTVSFLWLWLPHFQFALLLSLNVHD